MRNRTSCTYIYINKIRVATLIHANIPLTNKSSKLYFYSLHIHTHMASQTYNSNTHTLSLIIVTHITFIHIAEYSWSLIVILKTTRRLPQ